MAGLIVGQKFVAETLAGDIMHQCRRFCGLAHFGFISTPTRGVSRHMCTSVRLTANASFGWSRILGWPAITAYLPMTCGELRSWYFSTILL